MNDRMSEEYLGARIVLWTADLLFSSTIVSFKESEIEILLTRCLMHVVVEVKYDEKCGRVRD